jgi:thiol-disulfide isomerase/thioredoxin
MTMRDLLNTAILLTGCLLSLMIGAADLEVPTESNAHPPLKLQGLDGHQHSLEDYRGKIVLVNFWASWCIPCLREMPGMQRLAEKFSDRPFEIVAINVAEPRNVVAASGERMKIDFAILLDPEKVAMNNWAVKVLPTSYLLDTEGRIRYQAVGPFDWESDTANGAVESLLPARE